MTTTPAPVAPALPTATGKAAESPSTLLSLVAQPLGGILAFGLGVASFIQPSLHSGLGTPFGVALIVGGLGVYHVTINTVSLAN